MEFNLEPESILKVLGHPSSLNFPAITYLKGNGSQQTVTYTALHDAVAQLCDELQLRQPQQLLVAVCGDMSVSTVAVLLAALHSNAYYYVHPDLMELQSTRDIIACVAPAYIVVDKDCSGTLSWLRTGFIYVKNLRVFDSQFLIYASVNAQSSSSISNICGLAYVTTTSGSTGAPKVVFVPRSCVAPNIRDLVQNFRPTANDVIFNAAPLSFDPSIVNILVSLCSAAHLIIASKEMVPSVAIVSSLLKMRVTILQMTPSLLCLWHRQKNLSDCLFKEGSSIRILALGGEPVPVALLGCFWKQLQNADLYSLYGITEVSSWSSIKQITLKCTQNTSESSAAAVQNSEISLVSREEIDLGDLLSETSLCLVKGGIVCEDGCEGEIFLGRKNSCMIFDLVNTGRSVDRLSERSNSNKPELKLIQSTVTHNGMTMFPSGDNGVIKNKSIYFRGRRNRQIKIFGQKLNLVSLEDACMSVAGITACRFLSDSSRLFCFYTADVGDVMIAAAVRSAVLRLTRVPCKFRCLPQLPINSHSKIDDEQLMKELSLQTFQCLMSEEQFLNVINKLWFEFCRTEPKPDVNFLALGLDSLRAVEFLGSLEEQVNINFLGALDSLLNGSYSTVVQDLKKLFNSTLTVTEYSLSNTSENISTKKLKVFHKFYARVILSKSQNLISGIEISVKEHFFLRSARLVWTINLGKCIDATPVLVVQDDNSKPLLFIGAHSSQFCCVNAVTGSVRWSAMLESRMEASPAVNSSASQVYAACYAGSLYCFSVSSGVLLWKFKAGAEIKCSPIVDLESDKLYFGSHDKYFYCLDARGSLLWKALHSGGSIFASPCVTDIVYVACLKGAVGCYNKDSGKLMWLRNLSAPVFASLVSFCKGVLCVSVDGRLTALSSSGSVLWSYELKNQCYCTPRILRQTSMKLICLGDNSGTVYLISGPGLLVSHFNLGCRVVATPFLYLCNGVVMAALASTNGKVVFCKFEKNDDRQIDFSSKGIIGKHLVAERNTVKEQYDNDNCALESTTSLAGSNWLAQDLSGESDTKNCVLQNSLPVENASLSQWRSSLVYELSYPGEIFSSPLVYQAHLFVCGRENTVHCYKL